MPRFRVTIEVEAADAERARLFTQNQDRLLVATERVWTQAECDSYIAECHENGEIPCCDPEHHVWAVSDDNENYCYCEKCGCSEY